MLGDLALIEYDMFLWIDAAGDESGGDFAGQLGQFGRVLPDRYGVQIDNAVDAVVFLLQGNELDDGAEIIAQMQIAARLNAGKHRSLEPMPHLGCAAA